MTIISSLVDSMVAATISASVDTEQRECASETFAKAKRANLGVSKVLVKH
jgi:uncharacterized protein YejL (UPF0352 family)